MQPHDIALAVIAFASEFLGTLSGFGSSMFFVPAAIFFESAQFVLALTGILHCFGNLSKIILFRTHFEWKMFFMLSIPFVVCAGIGALLVVHYGTGNFQPALGAFLVLYALYSLFWPKRTMARIPRWIALPISAVSGLSTGYIGTGGALRGVALSLLQIPKGTFVAVSSAIDLGGDVLRTGIYLKNGFMNWDQWFYIPALAITAFAGAKAGHIFLGRIQQELFEKIVAAFIFISGIVMLLQ